MLESAVTASVETVYRALRDLHEEIVPEIPQSDCCSSQDPNTEMKMEHLPLSYTSVCDLTSEAGQVKPNTAMDEHNGRAQRTSSTDEHNGREETSQISSIS